MSTSLHRLCILAWGILLLGSIEPAAAQDNDSANRDTSTKSGVLISFKGGGDLVGNNVAAVYLRLLSQQGGMSTVSVTMGSDTICSKLEQLGFPPPCDPYLPLIDALNKAPVSKQPIQADTVIQFPGLHLSQTQSLRAYSKSDQAQVMKGGELLRNWAGAERIDPAQPSDSFGVKFKTYRLLVPTSDDRAALALRDQLKSLQTPNVVVSPLVTQAAPAKFNSYANFPAASSVQSDCMSQQIAQKIADYSQLTGGDASAQELMLQGLGTPRPVEVYLIDTVLNHPPSLRRALGEIASAAPWTCKWQDNYVDFLHHATHLAGLIAGSGAPFGFKGLASNVRLRSYEWWKPDDTQSSAIPGSSSRVSDLSDLITDNWGKLVVYVAAIEFDPYDGLAGGILSAPEKRFEGRLLEQTIKDAKPLVIAAAGQSKNGVPPLRLFPEAPISPQNLGDLPNVIVVTACSSCDENSSLFSNAYYSDPSVHFVHIAAPGVDPIAGWITDDAIGQSSGTSQAAAYVAGLAASMIGYFPNSYTSPDAVKMRLQATARPLPLRPDGTPNPDAQKIAAGIVDPILAQLDPSKHWLKQNGAWQSVKIAKWSAQNINIVNTNGRSSGFRSLTLLRLVKTRTTAGVPVLWTFYVDAYKAGLGNPADVARFDFVRNAGSTSLVLCNGSSVSLDKMDDFIIASQGIQPDECP